MDSIKKFFSEEEQANFRKLAQLQNERFELTLDSYRDFFITAFKEICEKEVESKMYGRITEPIKLIEHNYFKHLHKKLKRIKEEEILIFFNSLKNIYLSWIKSDSASAVLDLEVLLKKNNLLNYNKNIVDMFLYRGRKKDKYSFNKFDMFHIPYDKRYLISNQRYSLPGIPFLYLGTSVYDIVSEIDGDINEPFDIYCSFFIINKKLYTEGRYDVYDLRNEFTKMFENVLINSLISSDIISLKNLKSNFFKFILSSVCSFEKTTYKINSSSTFKNNFYEEYVLPQILTQVLIRKNFKGIMYFSTKLIKKRVDELSKTNVTLFTEYNEEHHYDRKLYNNFLISHPIQILKEIENENINLNNLTSLVNDIEKLDSTSKVSQIVLNFKNNNIKIKDVEYTEHSLGKTQLFLIYNYLIIEKNRLLKDK